MDPTVLQASEAARRRWNVPALVVETSLGGERASLALGCELEARFRVASITKPMTASLAVQLVDLDAPTGVWPEDVVLRHLLSHTTGYAGEIGDLSRFGGGDDALGRAVAELPSVHRPVGPDEVWSYANAGYWLAGWLAAGANRSTYEEALREHVLGPAGTKTAGFDEPSLTGSGPGSSGGAYPRARRPSGGIVASAGDVGCFADWQLREPWTSTLRMPLAETPRGVYGLGFAGEQVGNVAVWGHGGSYGGFQSSLLLVPEREAWLVGLTNSGVGRQALREVEDAWLEVVIGSRRGAAPTVEPSRELLERLAGSYRNENGSVVFTPGGEGFDVHASDEEGDLRATARAIGPATFEIVGGEADGDRFDFPLEGFTRFGSRLAQRVS